MRFFIVYAHQQLRSILSALLILSLLLPGNAGAQQSAAFKTGIPDQDINIILFRPSGNAILFSILTAKEAEIEVEYGRSPLLLDRQLKPGKTEAGKPLFFELSGLLPFTRYYYRVLAKRDGQYLKTEIASFQTSRKTSESFRFVVQADSHLDENTSPEQYTWNLKGMAKDSADLLIDLGDTWMTDKYAPEFEKSAAQYRAQRYYFSLIGKQTPVFLALGNHDGESGQKTRTASRELMRDWATAQRKFYFANPEPDRFYSGNNSPDPGNGFSADYYSWEWGNALFIVLDPFRFTISNRDPWSRTLGNGQYNWLKQVLEKSNARYRFVFIHNLTGGFDLKGQGRGGAEAALFYEWGGRDPDSSMTFTSHRPGWELPVHQLLVKHKVNVVFHGHDHFFARQELDGIIYQLVPQPGALHTGNLRMAQEYGYREGTFMNAPAYLRVSVSPSGCLLELIRSGAGGNQEVLYSEILK